MDKKKLNLVEATTSFLFSLEQSIITDYQIGLFIYRSYLSKSYRDNVLRLKKDYPKREDYNRLIQNLINQNIVSQKNNLLNSVFFIQNKPPFSIEEIVCIIDPFAYISHFSAMGYYNLSQPPKKMLFLSSYPLTLWRQQASIKMKKDCGGEKNFEIYSRNLPRLRRVDINKIPGTELVVYNDKNISLFSKGKITRFASIERTFLDMLRRPDLCGGMENVMQVYKKHVANHLEPVLKEIDTHANQIEKVRAGYILEEVCNIKDFIIEKWLQFVQRGSSRKLDPYNEFSSNYSERWCLSLNI